MASLVIGILLMFGCFCLILGTIVLKYSTGLYTGRPSSPGAFTVGIVAALCCLGGLLAAIGGVLWEVSSQPGVSLLAAGAGFCLLLALATFLLLLSAWRNPRAGGSSGRLELQRRIRLIQWAAWSVFVVAAVFAGPIWLVSLFFFFCLVDLQLQSAAQLRHSRQAGLLTCLAVAADQQRPMDEAIVEFAHLYEPRDPSKYLSLAAMVRAGYTIPEALMSIRGLVPQSTLPELFAASARGDLTGGLLRSSEQFESQSAFNAELLGFRLLTSTLFVTGMLFCLIASFMMIFIIPKHKKIFEDFDVELPAVTQAFVDLADHTYLLPPLVVAGLLFVMFCAAIERYYGWWDLSLDWCLKWFPRVDSPGVLAVLAPAVKQGRPLPEPLRQIAESHRRGSMRRRMRDVLTQVADGGDPWHALAKQRLLTRTESELLRNASRLNNLPSVLQMLSTTLTRRLRWRVMVSLELLRPSLILAMGAIVLFFQVAMFMPIVKLINDIF